MARPPKTFEHAAELAFIDAANPHQWLLTAISLHEQAVALWRNRGRSQLTHTAKDGTRITWDNTNRATFLLAAFAMENMLKAFLVYGHPEYIAGGRIQVITTHDLAQLSQLSPLVPYAARDCCSKHWLRVARAGRVILAAATPMTCAQRASSPHAFG